MSKFPEGIYDLLKTEDLLEELEDQNLLDYAEWGSLSKVEARLRLQKLWAKYFAERFSELLNEKKPETWVDELETWREKFAKDLLLNAALKPAGAEVLHGIKTASQKVLNLDLTRPDTALAASALLTGASRSPALHTQLQKELESCDQADWLVSFIKWSGLRPLLSTLQKFVARPNYDGSPKLRVATTSYMGATDVKAIKALLELPNTEVRISYDTKRTRLHAKAYLFHRKTGFGSAYIGSANVSKAALDDGLEWTAKISQYELNYLWKQAIASFESHWEDETEFTKCTKESLGELKQALAKESAYSDNTDQMTYFDLQPYDYQKIVLEDLQAERELDKNKHLVIAATGTGKTMIAAFDYNSYSKQKKKRPSLLFIAHREEILKQALNSYRQVLRDGSFGELLSGKHRPTQDQYLFCTVQSWNSQKLNSFAPDHFEYVVLDEAHHASASSYQRLVDHIRPHALLGLTATPERMDGLDIRNDFDGQFTHEIRLPEAIERNLLCPFHYYGIPDSSDIDFSRLSWRVGGYAKNEIAKVLDANEVRAGWVLSQCEAYLNEWNQVKGLGFCVSVEHAKFMAKYFSDHGVPCTALHGDSSQELRNSVQNDLLSGKIRFIFTVDLYNEGVDIPAANTVLFLRPTESLTVFLQQLGRGLRLHDDKAQLTVLDFIAPQHRNFRFGKRFQALSSRPELRIDDQIEKEMPFLPTGCLVHLEQQAKEHVLNNIRATTKMIQGKRLVSELRELKSQLGRRPNLIEMMDRFLLDTPDPLYRRGLPSYRMEIAENMDHTLSDKEDKKFAKGLRNLLLMDDPFLLETFQRVLNRDNVSDEQKSLFYTVLWGQKKDVENVTAAERFILDYPGLRDDLKEMLDWRSNNVHLLHQHTFPHLTGSLNLHASYTREQILLSLGLGSFEKAYPSREGVLHVPDRKIDAFFVDVNKSADDFSPTTMYDDYAITDSQFHWQSQNQTAEKSPVGQRYINHVEDGYTPILFVRDKNKLANGLTAPYIYLGPLKYRSHEGSKPISFKWELEYPMPAKILSWARRVA